MLGEDKIFEGQADGTVVPLSEIFVESGASKDLEVNVDGITATEAKTLAANKSCINVKFDYSLPVTPTEKEEAESRIETYDVKTSTVLENIELDESTLKQAKAQMDEIVAEAKTSIESCQTTAELESIEANADKQILNIGCNATQTKVTSVGKEKMTDISELSLTEAQKNTFITEISGAVETTNNSLVVASEINTQPVSFMESLLGIKKAYGAANGVSEPDDIAAIYTAFTKTVDEILSDANLQVSKNEAATSLTKYAEKAIVPLDTLHNITTGQITQAQNDVKAKVAEGQTSIDNAKSAAELKEALADAQEAIKAVVDAAVTADENGA